MLKRPLFLETFILLALVGFINYVAITHHLYWSINEFDSFVHFLGGALVSLFFLWFYFFSGVFSPESKNLSQFLIVSILGVLLVAVAWESYELILGEARFAKAEYPFDTLLDLLMDLLGGLAACLYGYLKKIKSEL